MWTAAANRAAALRRCTVGHRRECQSTQRQRRGQRRRHRDRHVFGETGRMPRDQSLDPSARRARGRVYDVLPERGADHPERRRRGRVDCRQPQRPRHAAEWPPCPVQPIALESWRWERSTERALWGTSPIEPSTATEAKWTSSAPGVEVLSSFPATRYARKSGTSMAAPHVAGMIALLLEADPGMNGNDIYQRLASAEPDTAWLGPLRLRIWSASRVEAKRAGCRATLRSCPRISYRFLPPLPCQRGKMQG